jgi:tetratricopeptide (TPR) repeat protein
MWRIRKCKHPVAAIVAILAALVCARAAPMPEGAIAALWQAAADLRAAQSYTGAVATLERLAALTPHDPSPLIEIGDIYLSQRRWPLAADAFNRALARRADLASAWAGLAAAEWGQGNRLPAIAHWQTALQHQPDLLAARLGLARAHLEQGQANAALELLHTGLALSRAAAAPAACPMCDEARWLLAAILTVDEPDAARAALASIPDDAPPPAVARRDYLIATLDRAAAANSPAAAAKTIGLALAQAELWPIASAALNRAVLLDPTDAEARAFLGYFEGMLGRPALRHLDAAVYLAPDHPLPRYLRGRHYLRTNLLPLAIVDLSRVVELDPGNVQAWLDLGQAYERHHDYAKAIAAFDAAATAAPDDVEIQLARVRFYADTAWRVTEPGGGLDAARAAADLAPQDARARDYLGWLYLLAADLPQARLHLLSALALDSTQASTYYHLGELYARLGWPEMAATAWTRAVDLDREGDIRARALARLAARAQ